GGGARRPARAALVGGVRRGAVHLSMARPSWASTHLREGRAARGGRSVAARVGGVAVAVAAGGRGDGRVRAAAGGAAARTAGRGGAPAGGGRVRGRGGAGGGPARRG